MSGNFVQIKESARAKELAKSVLPSLYAKIEEKRAISEANKQKKQGAVYFDGVEDLDAIESRKNKGVLTRFSESAVDISEKDENALKHSKNREKSACSEKVFTEKWANGKKLSGNIIPSIISEDKTAPLPELLDLKKFFWGKHVAIVGNGVPEKDFSAEIDSAEVVVRFNNFYNMKSGRVGRKLDFLVITPSSHWHDGLKDGERGESEILRQKPIVCFVRHELRARWRKFIEIFKGLRVFKAAKINGYYQTFTTGGTFLAWCADHLQNVKVSVYGFGDNGGFASYLNKQGQHYISFCEKEKCARDVSIEVLSRKHIFTQKSLEEFQKTKTF